MLYYVLLCSICILLPLLCWIVYLFFLLWNSSDSKGTFSLYAFIVNNKILLYLYCICIFCKLRSETSLTIESTATPLQSDSGPILALKSSSPQPEIVSRLRVHQQPWRGQTDSQLDHRFPTSSPMKGDSTKHYVANNNISACCHKAHTESPLWMKTIKWPNLPPLNLCPGYKTERAAPSSPNPCLPQQLTRGSTVFRSCQQRLGEPKKRGSRFLSPHLHTQKWRWALQT